MKIVIFIFTLVAFVTTGFAQKLEVDSRDAARAFAVNPAEYYTFDVTYIFGDNRLEHMFGQMNLNFEITSMEIESQEIPIPSENPLRALPFPEESPRQMYFNMSGRNSDGESVSYGFASLRYPRPGDVITVALNPSSIQQKVEFDVPEGVDENNLEIRVANTDRSLGWWDFNEERFTVWVNPVEGPVLYDIIDVSTGIIYLRGVLVPYEDQSEVMNEGVINVQRAGAVQEIDLRGDAHTYFPRQVLGGQTMIRGVQIPAASYYMIADPNVREVTDFTYWGPVDVRILIEEVEETGPRRMIAELTPEVEEWDGKGRVHFGITPGGTAVIITIIPAYLDERIEVLQDDLRGEGFTIWVGRGARG